MMRAALYARYSSDLQSPTSIADQLHLCRRLAELLGAHVVREFTDAAISGKLMVTRPGVVALMAGAEAGDFDIVIAEHTDRLSRGGSDSWSIYEDLKALGVAYHTVNQGKVSAAHLGMATAMSVMQLEELALKVRRGQEGEIRRGRHQAVPSYAYRIRLEYDAKGDRVRGLREIVPEEAEVVRRIFRDYAAGISPLAIAQALNAEGVPPPRAARWSVTSIHGERATGSGIIRNELYRGRIVWGRRKWTLDRRTGQRRRLVNPAELAVHDVPEMRIVDEELWQAAQVELERRARGPRTARGGGPGGGQRRPSRLLSGLIRCGFCDGPMVLSGPHEAMVCRDRVVKGRPCGNDRRPGYRILEARVLACVQANLLHPDVVAEASREYQRLMGEAQRQTRQDGARHAKELAEIERRMARLIDQVEQGMPWTAVAERHAALEARAQEIRSAVAQSEGRSDVVALHPNAGGMFRKLVGDLSEALETPAGLETAQARAAIRGLVEEVRFLPREGKGKYDLNILANLAPAAATQYDERTAGLESEEHLV